ncbi:hypothetical protein STEG23_012553, partial [Scotinomys teguina]
CKVDHGCGRYEGLLMSVEAGKMYSPAAHVLMPRKLINLNAKVKALEKPVKMNYKEIQTQIENPVKKNYKGIETQKEDAVKRNYKEIQTQTEEFKNKVLVYNIIHKIRGPKQTGMKHSGLHWASRHALVFLSAGHRTAQSLGKLQKPYLLAYANSEETLPWVAALEENNLILHFLPSDEFGSSQYGGSDG